ncbi:4-(cytidine 5'-diphospho)-2-C-methyl-D-erythritol kinase [Maritimibacter sp. HL-12]|uniref:4-(cytidine 5'-diphospho)-2-C-methyl-D-erythritol kinase n=1 Tax=Maritimibacter sp. HL-12 TaxID=1162418 RepID=UPI000A0EF722|nr:4-(cytidine 5'-diphospho)-2-C-methyl-D-erythritol kinase [Maritimibacter sp. HL-12]SMH40915.1 4-diphosphocytidyl-2-C-methyl-D-erythritol kinase [Maritimibacter sp. HL-12]
MMTKTFAPAKINLTLHVTGQRADGYHLLDSLVMFADVGDRVRLVPADAMSLEVTGPMAAGVPADASNLVWKAAALHDLPVAITLEKHLPTAGGIGGGSSDAAATLFAMVDLTGNATMPEGATALGSDVRVCLARQAARMRGVGDEVQPVQGVPELHVVLANPGVAMSTPEVFAALESKQNEPMPKRIPRWRGAWSAIDWISKQRNDLEAPALKLAPVIGDVLAALTALPGARMARMSGSGATCFALFEDRAEADAAADDLADAHPDWWVTAASLH